jgi:hypothetical protein
MMHTIVVSQVIAAVLAVTPALAQQTVGSYYAALGPQDWVNSRGERLRDFGAVFQQDRANYHRFNRRDPQDEGDGFFGDQALRAAIPALFAAGDNAAYWRSFSPPTSPPLDADVYVVICATGGRISHIIVNSANGDGYEYCEGPVFAGE